MRTLIISLQELNDDSQEITKVERRLDFNYYEQTPTAVRGKILTQIVSECNDMLETMQQQKLLDQKLLDQ